MSKFRSRSRLEKYHFPNSWRLRHEAKANPRSLGCETCPFLKSCGGLHVGAGIFDCMAYCRCVNPDDCDNVCPSNASHLVARSREVHGLWSLRDIPRAPCTFDASIPMVVPMIYHSSARSRPPVASMVALSLYQFIDKKAGTVRFPTRAAMLDFFKLGKDTKVILTGTAVDRPIERWWALEDRASVISGIKQLGVWLATSPNFSLFNDVPRHDNMYNMKRIAQSWSEIQGYGVPCAIHLNARTDRDWKKWVDFLDDHSEIKYVAFEFGTGAGCNARVDWYVKNLIKLAGSVGRPLHLVARGGLRETPGLARAFCGFTIIETSAFIRAQKRRRCAIIRGRLEWMNSPTPPGCGIDDLFDHNFLTIQDYAEGLRFGEQVLADGQ